MLPLALRASHARGGGGVGRIVSGIVNTFRRFENTFGRLHRQISHGILFGMVDSRRHDAIQVYCLYVS